MTGHLDDASKTARYLPPSEGNVKHGKPSPKLARIAKAKPKKDRGK
jgi:hypothetical protein